MCEQVAFANYNAVVFPLLMGFALLLVWLYVRLRGGRRAVTIRHAVGGLNPSVIFVGVMWLLGMNPYEKELVRKMLRRLPGVK